MHWVSNVIVVLLVVGAVLAGARSPRATGTGARTPSSCGGGGDWRSW